MDNVKQSSFSYAAEAIRIHHARVSAARSVMDATFIQPLFNHFIKEFIMTTSTARADKRLTPLRLILDEALVVALWSEKDESPFSPIFKSVAHTNDGETALILQAIRMLTRVGQDGMAHARVKQLAQVIIHLAATIALIEMENGIERTEAPETQKAPAPVEDSSTRNAAYREFNRFKNQAGYPAARSLILAFENGCRKVGELPYEKLKLACDVLSVVNPVLENAKEDF